MTLSQEALADVAGIGRSYMSGIERGVRNCSTLHLIRVARALRISVGDLFVKVKVTSLHPCIILGTQRRPLPPPLEVNRVPDGSAKAAVDHQRALKCGSQSARDDTRRFVAN
ncbi:MAG TPA: helix-turn-helix transcriptional regulator [Vicinamibacterales bacterium]|nr:helix-turn-helix transcriptional regulator [Vicinamibacterales bacterium]